MTSGLECDQAVGGEVGQASRLAGQLQEACSNRLKMLPSPVGSGDLSVGLDQGPGESESRV